MARRVEVLTSELVVPAEETPAESIWLSNLDLAARRGYTPTVYFYRPNGEPGFFAADAVKHSLAKALVAFDPLAGRLGLDATTSRVQVDCTAEGAVFVTARSDYALDDLMNEFVPCPEMRDRFVPPTPAPNPPCALLFVQVTPASAAAAWCWARPCTTRSSTRAARPTSSRRGPASPAGTTTTRPTTRPCRRRASTTTRCSPARPIPTRLVAYDHPEYKPEPEPVDPVTASTYASARSSR
ncbi:hypothetical protein PR202_gb29906 [Eleusine coracana subsp. coracana]|uniref:Uncharacterized protein n=1 Tax=Eleusine coracana subsp. coracana TaxID=191504 RepID=A0AAV5G141_ELECO|nr:hypothetical protein PR202_gb29906 [Eleusine coracana subsp. coracana]